MSQEAEDAGTYDRVSVRFVGPDVDPSLVTSRLGIAPTRAHTRGEALPSHPSRTYPTGVWSLDSGLSETEPLEVQLSSLLNRLEQVANTVRDLTSSGYYCDFFCSHFPDRNVGRIELTPRTLSRIAAMGIGLTIDVYTRSDDEDAMDNALA